MSPKHEDALRLTALKLKVQWLSAPTIGKRSTGKRPLETGWQTKGFAEDPGLPHAPGCNLGVQTGRVEGTDFHVIAVDLDSEAALEWARGALPATPMKTSTGKGEHWFYRYPENAAKIPNKCRFTLPNGTKLEIDIRGDGGNIVVAPSVHWTGCSYTEVEPWAQVDRSKIPVYNPDWLDGHKISHATGRPKELPAREELNNLEQFIAEFPTEPPTDEERHGLLPEQFQTRLYNNCKARYGGEAAIKALKAMALGQPYAAEGERNDTLFQATRLLTEWFHEVPDSFIEDFLRGSLLATGDKPEHEELANFRDVLRRSREKYAQRDHMLLHMFKKGIAPTRALIAAGLDISKALIVALPNGFHLSMQQDGRYGVAARKRSELLPSIDHDNLLGWAVRGGIARFEYTDNKGRVRKLDWDSIAKQYVWPVNQTLGSFSRDFSQLDGDTFYEAIAPRREDLKPLYNARVQRWLELFGGENKELLLDWAATFPMLNKPTSALFLIGAAGAGKNLWADGLARLWVSGKPVPFEVTLRDFNEDLEKSPFIFADEKLPLDPRGHVELDTHLRALITSTTQTLYRKHQKAIQVDGALRILAATNQHNFTFKGMDTESQKALAERILLIEPQEDAATYLRSLGGRESLEEWVAGDAIIKHVLWLSEHRKVQLGLRLLVPGNGLSLIHRAQNKEGVPADLCTWLCNFILDPRETKGLVRWAVRYGTLAENGELWVSPTLLSEAGEELWCRYVRHGRAALPSQTKLSQSLGPLSIGKPIKRRGVPENFAKNGRSTYYTVDLGQLYAFAQENGFDVEAIQEALGVVPPRNSSPPPAPQSDERRAKFDAIQTKLLRDCAPLFSALAVAEQAEKEGLAPPPIQAPRVAAASREVPSLKAPEAPKAPKPRAKKEPKPKPQKVREERTEEYFTPQNCFFEEALERAAVQTEEQAVAFWSPLLSEAMSACKGPGFAHPATYARLVAAYRAHRWMLRNGYSPVSARLTAVETWADHGERPWFAETSLSSRSSLASS